MRRGEMMQHLLLLQQEVMLEVLMEKIFQIQEQEEQKKKEEENITEENCTDQVDYSRLTSLMEKDDSFLTPRSSKPKENKQCLRNEPYYSFNVRERWASEETKDMKQQKQRIFKQMPVEYPPCCSDLLQLQEQEEEQQKKGEENTVKESTVDYSRLTPFLKNGDPFLTPRSWKPQENKQHLRTDPYYSFNVIERWALEKKEGMNQKEHTVFGQARSIARQKTPVDYPPSWSELPYLQGVSAERSAMIQNRALLDVMMIKQFCKQEEQKEKKEEGGD